MAHEEYTRLVPGSDSAVLFIHGILGTPDHFADFLPLIPEGVSVINLLLDGHGKGVRDFSRTSMKKWEAQVEAAVDSLLATGKKLYIAAHSLGTLLAIGEAVKKPVAGLFLLAVPIRLHIRPIALRNVLNIYLDRIKPEDPWGTAIKNCCGTALDRNLLRYLGWIPRFLELFGKIRRTRALLPSLNIPCTAFKSRHDELVSAGSADYLLAHCGMTAEVLPNSGHYYYDPKDLELLKAKFSEFLS